MNTVTGLVLGGAQAFSGLVAGIYLAFLVAFMPALHHLDDEAYRKVFGLVDKAIVNPAFLLFFFGAPVLAAVVLVWVRTPSTILALVLGIAPVVITFAANIPLNNSLADGALRKTFEKPWLAWHSLRTLTAAVSFVLLLTV